MPPLQALDWSEAAAAGASEAGGKGWNLGRLARFGFPVPQGFVLPASVYTAFMGTGALRRLAADLAGTSASDAAADDVSARLSRLRAAIGAAPLPPGAETAARAALARLALDRVPLAVRSSATAEDGGSTSFAGVHLSVLDVTGPDAVLRAVRDVWGSLWTPQALTYRRRFLIPDADAACAVVVCRMVRPVAAGVAFTCDPRTGRRDVVAISAAPGLGDAVVSGAVNPEEITVSLSHLGLALESRTGPAVLDDPTALAVARLALRVQSVLGDSQDPQDVEWAWDGSRVWLLQARPVTRVPRRDFPGAERFPLVWSSTNIKDAVPFVMTPMSWSCILAALRFLMWSYPAAIGYPVPRGMEVARRFHGRGYFDATNLQWLFYDCFGSDPAELMRGMGGHHGLLPVPPGSPFRGWKGLARLWRLAKGGWALVRVPSWVPAEIDAMFARVRELEAVDVSDLTDAGLLDLLVRISLAQAAFGGPFMMASSLLGWQGELEKQLENLAPGRGRGLAAALVAGTGAVVSAQHGTRLFDVADAARADPAALAWFQATPFEAGSWRTLAADAPFRRAFDAFLAEFGHRAVYEAEIATPRWSEDPSWLLEQVRAILEGHGRRPDGAARERREAAEREIRSLTWLRRPGLGWLVRRARQGAALRERAKSALVAQVGPLRRALLEAGSRLAASGAIAAREDVFFLSWGDVEARLRGEWDGTGARALVSDRREQVAAWERESAPDVIVAGAPAAPPPPPAKPVDGMLRGMGVSSGRATGPARLIRHPAEGHRLKQGDVLVAPSTDPGWTPLFLRASAVVMEVGGMLSHGAIVAREYALPAVVNIPGLLGALRDGQNVTVDGNAGTVVLTDPPG